MMSEMLQILLTKISLPILSIAACKFGMGNPCRLPLSCGHILMPWLSSRSGTVVTVDTSSLMKQGYKANLLLAARWEYSASGWKIPVCQKT